MKRQKKNSNGKGVVNGLKCRRTLEKTVPSYLHRKKEITAGNVSKWELEVAQIDSTFEEP